MDKLAIIGLDCADPKLVFEEFIDDLPTFRKLLASAEYGNLRSTIPPITVPAWMCMVTGKDPGELGIYGFRNRSDYTYEGLRIANSQLLEHETAWETLGRHGYKSIVLGVPMTYPPRPINGHLVASFLTPSTDAEYTHPAGLRDEIARWVGDYMIDVPNFRTDDKETLLADIHKMTRKRFLLAQHLVTEKAWDFFMMVEMGPDRMHHAFWAHHDRQHHKHDSESKFVRAIRDYYIALDEQIAALIECLPPDTQILIVSDHGIQPMKGGICVNEWLQQQGYLSLRRYPSAQTRFADLSREGQINWRKTKAWGSGGYYGRIFLNIKGREPNGCIRPSRANRFRDRLIRELEGIEIEHGNPLGTVVFKPDEVYRQVRRIPPDLIVYFGDLTLRSIGSMGHHSIWTHENDTGPDDANHHPDGLWLWAGAESPGRRDRGITEIHSLILNAYGIQQDEAK